ncbi:MAG: acetylornithine deacetylase [Gammaproteobacteria bacterium]|nr:acetylornithine deacetylase [Gammaproteobacteria bacterium]
MPVRLPSIVDMLDRLVASPSVSSVNPAFDQSNRPVVDLLADWLEGLGFAIELMPVPQRPGKFNLIATRGDGAAGLVLAGHTDTVPYDAGAWRSDPFELTERDGRLHGLGTCDMKGFFPLALAAVQQHGDALAAPLTVLATADEESSMSGARALVEAGLPHGRHALIGEPTDMRPIRAHKGVLIQSIRVQGRSGHSSDPALGRNALEGMHRVLGALLGWRDELQSRYQDPAFAVATPTVNLGYIHGGDNPNRICAACELQIDVRILPGMDPVLVQRELDERVTEALRGSELTGIVTPMCTAIPALATAAGAAVVTAVEELTGSAAGTVAFASEGPYLNALGMDTVLFGPGSIACAHQPDEYVELERLQPTIDVLARLISRFCREPGR